MLLFVLYLTALSLPENSYLGIPKSQLLQETIPSLEQDVRILETRIQAKKKFYLGEETCASSFWEFDHCDLFRLSSLNIHKNLIMGQYQQRLTQNFINLVDEGINQKISHKISDLSEKRWNKQNELDALNLRLLELFSNKIQEHFDDIQRLNSIEEQNRSFLEQDPILVTEKSSFASVVQQNNYITRLKAGLIRSWFHLDETEIETIAVELIEDPMVQGWSLKRQKETFEMFVPWQKNSATKTQIGSIISEIEQKLFEQKQRLFEQEWSTLQKEWPEKVSSWKEDRAQKELKELEKKREGFSVETEPQKTKILSFQIRVLNDHIEKYSNIRNQAELRESEARLQEARQKELEAQQNAVQKRIQQEVVRLREIEMNLRANELKRHKEIEDHHTAATKEFVDIQTVFSEWNGLSPLSPKKKELWETHIRKIQKFELLVQKAIRDLDSIPSLEEFDSSEDDPSIRQALLDIERARVDRSTNVRQECQRFFTLWIAINEHKSRIRMYDVQSIDGQKILDSVQFEGEHIFLAMGEHFARTKGWFRDINHILDLLRILFWGGIVFVCWQWLLHRIFPVWLSIRFWMNSQDRLHMGYETQEESTFAEEQESRVLLHQMYYLLSAFVLHSLLYGTIFRVFTSVLLLLLGLRLVTLSTIIQKIHTETHDQLRRSLRIFVVATFGWNILEEVLQNVFFVYQGALVLHWMQNVILLLFFLVQLGTWSQYLGKKSAQTVGLRSLKRIRSHFSNGVIGARFRSLFSLMILLFDLLGRMIFWFIEHSSLFGSTLALSALEDTAKAHDGLISFDSRDWDFENTILLEPYAKKVLETISDWEHDKKRGSVVITGDEGMGKSHLITLIMNEKQTSSFHCLLTRDIQRNENWNRLTVLHWIARSLGFDPDRIQSTQDIIDVLNEKPSTFFVLDNVHHIFLRIVEGFVVLDTLFTVIQETSNRHFWILTCHLPTWKFITSPATPIQSNFFRTEVQLAPWSVQELQTHLKNYVEQKEQILDFSSLTTLKNSQSVHRAQMSYWRLLTDASKGNPSIAFELFLYSLFQEKDGEEKVLSVKLFPLLKTAEIQKLDDMSCFVLSSIVLHQEIRFSELCRSLQIGSEIIQSICKNLVDMDIIVLDDQEYTVRTIWYPWVERVLLQKRFVSMRL